MNTDTCPKTSELEEFSSGRLAGELVDSVEQHLTACLACRQIVEELDSKLDVIEQLLRKAAFPSGSPTIDEREYQSAVETICQWSLPQFTEAAVDSAGLATTASGEHDATVSEVGAMSAERPLQDESAKSTIRALGQYELLEEIGRGGMGVVYRARHRKLDRQVALKVVPESLLSDPTVTARFENEIKAIGQLDHPNIVRATDAGEIDGVHALVMEYVDGRDLAFVMRNRGPLPESEACELILQAAQGLRHIHEAGLVHRDIKPRNLMLASNGVVRILDLGLALLVEARRANPNEGITATGQVMGTIDYMAPEQANNTRNADVRADIYGLGATFYALLAGHAPFANEGAEGVLQKLTLLATRNPTPVKTLRPELRQSVCDVVRKMMAKEPIDRYQNLEQVIAALGQIQGSSNSGNGPGTSHRSIAGGVIAFAVTLLLATLVVSATSMLRPASTRTVTAERSANVHVDSVDDKGEKPPEPLPFRTQYEAAEWILDCGGVVDAMTKSGPKNSVVDSQDLTVDFCVVSRVALPEGTNIFPADLGRVAAALPQLQVLEMLWHQRLETAHLRALSTCRELSVVFLGTVEKSDVDDQAVAEFLAQLPELRHLDLFGLGLSGDCVLSLPCPQKLTHLYMGSPRWDVVQSQFSQVSVEWIESLAKFPNLQALQLPRVELSPQHILSLGKLPALTSFANLAVPDARHECLRQYAQLPHLEYLTLKFELLDDSHLVELEGCRLLKELALGNTKITDSGVRRFQQRVPDCRVLTNEKIYDPPGGVPASTEKVQAVSETN